MVKKSISIIIFLAVFFQASFVNAGFGISPPYVRSDKLTPGSTYEQTVTLLRSSAEEDLQATVTINAPEISDRITIRGGETFDLPKDKLQVPMVVVVNVPTNAALDVYKGYINIRIAPKDQRTGGVAIALGARVEIDLTVSNLTISDFKVRRTEIENFEELSFPWNMKIFSWFFYRLRMNMTVENLGNQEISPSSVKVDITDISKRNTLATVESTRFSKVSAFEVGDIETSFPVSLESGQYWALIKVYKDNEIVWTDDKTFTIAKAGEMGDSAPTFGIWPWLLMALYIFIVLIFLALLVKIKSWRYLLIVLSIFIGKPLGFIFGLLGSSFRDAKVRFWKWMAKKASKYQDTDRRK